MSGKIFVSGTTSKRIRDTSAKLPRLEVSEVAKALGAEPTGDRLRKALAPLTLSFVRVKLIEQIESRRIPALEETTRQIEIPITDQQAMQLQKLAQDMSTEGFAPSAGQVASALLPAALESVATKGNLKPYAVRRRSDKWTY